MSNKVAVSGGLKARTRNVMEQAIEGGIRVGWNRAHKNIDDPKEEHIIDNLIDATMQSIDEWFHFEDDILTQ